MHGLQWDYSFPRSPHRAIMDKVAVKLGGQYLSIYDEKNIQKIDNYI
jgi:hypothetical protein